MSKFVDLIKPQLPSIIRRLMTASAAVLGTYGVLPKSETAQFVEVGSAIVLAAIPEVWSWISNQIEQQKLVAAAKTGNPLAPPATKAETVQAMETVKAAIAPPPPPIPAINLNAAAPPAPPTTVIS